MAAASLVHVSQRSTINSFSAVIHLEAHVMVTSSLLSFFGCQAVAANFRQVDLSSTKVRV